MVAKVGGRLPRVRSCRRPRSRRRPCRRSRRTRPAAAGVRRGGLLGKRLDERILGREQGEGAQLAFARLEQGAAGDGDADEHRTRHTGRDDRRLGGRARRRRAGAAGDDGRPCCAGAAAGAGSSEPPSSFGPCSTTTPRSTTPRTMRMIFCWRCFCAAMSLVLAIRESLLPRPSRSGSSLSGFRRRRVPASSARSCRR